METHELTAHPAYPPWAVTSVTARTLSRDKNWLLLRWRIEGSGKLLVPAFAGKGRADELWRTTCFELFLKPGGGTAYCEFNLSPSERWAAYDFSDRRDGMEDRPVPREPECTMRQGSSFAKSEWQHSSNAPTQTAGAPNTDIVRGLENGILSLHNHLKTLEGKYIDLANYYKQELIQAN